MDQPVKLMLFKQMIEKALVSLEGQTPQEKFIGSETLPFDPSQLDEVKELADDFFNKLGNLSAKGKTRTEDYHLGMQFVTLA